jgi:surface antigen
MTRKVLHTALCAALLAVSLNVTAQSVPVPGGTNSGYNQVVPVPGSQPAYGMGGQVPVPGAYPQPGQTPPPASYPAQPDSGGVAYPPSTPAYPPVQQPVATTLPADIAQGECNASLIPGVSNQALGSVVGGILGGVLGAQVGEGKGNTLATLGGAVAGAIAGGLLGKNMSQADEACVSRALEYAPPGQAITWKNPDTQSQFALTPGQIYQKNGQDCRDYSLSGTDAPAAQTGTACRGGDGQWQALRF